MLHNNCPKYIFPEFYGGKCPLAPARLLRLWLELRALGSGGSVLYWLGRRICDRDVANERTTLWALQWQSD